MTTELTENEIRDLVANLTKPKWLVEFLEARQPPPADIRKLISFQDIYQLGDATTIALGRNFILRYFVTFRSAPRFLLTAPTIVRNVKATFPMKSGLYYILNCGGVSIFNTSYNQVWDVVVDKDVPLVNGVYVRNSDSGRLIFVVGFTNVGKIDMDSLSKQFVDVANDPDLKIGALGIHAVKQKKNVQPDSAETSAEEPTEKRPKMDDNTDALQRLIDQYAQHQ